MGRTEPDLVREIESAALDPASDLATVLRKCIALGGVTGSESLRAWASLELKGYGTEDDLPAYRTIHAPLYMDAVLGGVRMVTGQTVPPTLIPDFAQEAAGNSVHFPQPIAEISSLIRSAENKGEGSIQLGPPGGAHIVQYINMKMAADDPRRHGRLVPNQMIERIYWSVSIAPLQRILDVVRTTLVELMAEMRAGTPPGQRAPSREVAEQAVSVAVNGKRNRVVINQVAPGGEAVASAGGAASLGAEPEPKGRKVMWWLVGLATIVAAVAAVWVLIVG